MLRPNLQRIVYSVLLYFAVSSARDGHIISIPRRLRHFIFTARSDYRIDGDLDYGRGAGFHATAFIRRLSRQIISRLDDLVGGSVCKSIISTMIMSIANGHYRI